MFRGLPGDVVRMGAIIQGDCPGLPFDCQMMHKHAHHHTTTHPDALPGERATTPFRSLGIVRHIVSRRANINLNTTGAMLVR